MFKQPKPCPICGNQDAWNFVPIPEGKNPQRIQCNICNFIFFPTNNHPEPVYDLKYNLHFFRPGDIRKAGIMAEVIANVAKKHFRDPRILEIGPGNGLTTFLVQELKYKISAIDLDILHCAFLLDKYNIHMIEGNFETYKFERKYNLIYASHVLEHSKDPIRFLKKAHETLTKKGILFIDTPDGNCVHTDPKNWRHFKTRHKYEHCSIFTPHTLKLAAGKAGFKFRYFRRLHQFQNFQVSLFKNL